MGGRLKGKGEGEKEKDVERDFRGGFFRLSPRIWRRCLGMTTTTETVDLSTISLSKDSLTQGLELGELRFLTIRNLSQKCPSQH